MAHMLENVGSAVVQWFITQGAYEIIRDKGEGYDTITMLTPDGSLILYIDEDSRQELVEKLT